MGGGIQCQIAPLAVAGQNQIAGCQLCSFFQVLKGSDLCGHGRGITQHKVFLPAHERGVCPSVADHDPHIRNFKGGCGKLDAARRVHIIDLVKNPDVTKSPAFRHQLKQRAQLCLGIFHLTLRVSCKTV